MSRYENDPGGAGDPDCKSCGGTSGTGSDTCSNCISWRARARSERRERESVPQGDRLSELAASRGIERKIFETDEALRQRLATHERARDIVLKLRASHHRVAKDMIAFLVGSKPGLLLATEARGLDKRATTRAERKMSHHLAELGIAPPRIGMTDAEKRPFYDLQRAVAQLLKEHGHG